MKSPTRCAPRCAASSNLSFHLGEVQEINLREKYVITNNDHLPYDYLVLALGGETHYFGLKSVAQFGFGLKDLDDALNIRNHLLQQFEKAIFETDNEKREALLTFVIAGGGPTGVECAGAISELVRIVLKKDYPTLDESDIRVVLLEAGEKLLVSMPAELGEATLQVLEQKKHVEVIFGSTVTNFDGAEVSLKDGTSISANTLIWAAGVRAVGLLDTLGLEQDRLGRLIVAPTLQVPGYPEVFVIGDAASLEGKDGKPLPMIAPVAMQQAGVAAKNLSIPSRANLVRILLPRSGNPGDNRAEPGGSASWALEAPRYRGLAVVGGYPYLPAGRLSQPDGSPPGLGLELPVL